VYCAIVVQEYFNSVGNADGEGQEKDDSLVQKSFEVNEYLVKANPTRLTTPHLVNSLRASASLLEAPPTMSRP